MRDVKHTTRFQRDYRREKPGRHCKKLDVLLMDVVNLLAADTPLPLRNFDYPLFGECNDPATATSGRISFSSTASRMTAASSLCALARIVNWGCERRWS
jgi:mRNA interferase YafQ